jgi:vacuolar-type H+-ATPase subunit I/STV1
MSAPDSCSECAAILEEFRTATDEIASSAEGRAARKAMFTVFNSTDENEVDEALRKHGFRAFRPGEAPLVPSPGQLKLQQALARLRKRAKSSGHWPLPGRHFFWMRP